MASRAFACERSVAMNVPDQSLRFKILGPLVVIDAEGERLDVKGPSQRRLLALLLLHANTVLSAERVAEWCGLSAGGLRTAVSRLRRIIGESAVQQEFPGYVLRTNEIDAQQFNKLVKTSRTAQPSEAVTLLESALALWEGEALADFAYEPWARASIGALNETRAAAIEERGELLLRVGRWTDVIVSMESHVAAFPLRDRPRALLMRALAADGRQTEALRAYQTYREYLAEEVGTEPNDALRSLESKIATGWSDRVELERTTLRGSHSRDRPTSSTGNLRAPATSFIGRTDAVRSIAETVQEHRLVTLTGIGGVGKTRLARQVAAELAPTYREGAWIVELASVDDQEAVADVVATTLGVTSQPGKTITECLTGALAEQHVLLILDNCEHVLEAATNLIDEVLAGSTTVSILATSREGTRLAGEHLWPVQPLECGDGLEAPAAQLFIERARAVNAAFDPNPEGGVDAVSTICRRLDGIPLAIELAAARMLTLTPAEVAELLDDRFRLLSGSPRAIERHQTLRQAVQWSYDLLTPSEQEVFRACAVFAGGFELGALTAVAQRYDQFAILDALESLVRKSLVIVDQTRGRTRYNLLETIRLFAEEQLVERSDASRGRAEDASEIEQHRRRHARHFADRVEANFELWSGPRMREAADWVAAEFDNLRVGLHSSTELNDVSTATAIAAHTPLMAFTLQRLEPVRWAEELLADAATARTPQLPRLYTAASLCSYMGRHDDALRYAEAAADLHSDADFEPLDTAWVEFRRAVAELDGGRPDRYLAICSDLAYQEGLSQVVGLCGLAAFLPLDGRANEAMAVAEQAMAAAQVQGHPYWIAFAYVGYGRAFAQADPGRALDDVRTGLAYAKDHAMPYWAAVLAREAGGLEAVHGDPDQALELLHESLESFHQAGNQATVAWTLASLAVLFERLGRNEAAATFYGATSHHRIRDLILGLPEALERLRAALGAEFTTHVDLGAAMTTTESVRFAQSHIDSVRQHA